MKRLAVILVLALCGCDNPFRAEAPSPVFVTKTVVPDFPDECTSPDPQWINPPVGFEPLKHINEREIKNGDHFDDMRSDRAVCRAGLLAIKERGKGHD